MPRTTQTHTVEVEGGREVYVTDIQRGEAFHSGRIVGYDASGEFPSDPIGEFVAFDDDFVAVPGQFEEGR